MSGELGGPPNDPITGPEETAMIRAMAEAIAIRVGLDMADGKLLDRPFLLLLFLCENILDRLELLERVHEIKHEKGNGK
jgi:hypothetical protein